MSEANIVKMRPAKLPHAEFQPTSLMDKWSLEATLPSEDDITSLANFLDPGTRIYLSILPRISYAKQIEAARLVAREGLEPIPHLSARKFRDRSELVDYLRDMQEIADVRRLLIIAGDLTRPEGPYNDTIDLLNDEAFLDCGIKNIGIAGHPEGHPLVGNDRLDRLIASKIELASKAGISVELVTQFSFDPAAILSWYRRLRGQGVTVPIRIGLAGPASPSTLLKLAMRCGVNLPLRQTNVAVKLLRGRSSDDIIAELAEGPLGTEHDPNVSLHFYSFGGIKRTAQWARMAEADFAENR